jgi:hypothetical protein
MADLMSILSANYKVVGSTTPSKTPYVAVDPALYQGTWTGTYANNKSFKITVSNVSGFRAQVRYESDGTQKYQSVLIKDSSFRVGDTKFTLTGPKTAQIKNVVTDPVSGQTYLDKANAQQAS